MSESGPDIYDALAQHKAQGSDAMTRQQTQTDAIHAYVDAFTSLTPENLDQLVALVADDVRFVDPFNDARGRAAFRAIFTHMFETTIDPIFTVSDIAISTGKNPHIAYIRWRMTARTKGRPSLNLDLAGMSEVHINEQGLVTAHIDHWDSASQLLARLPFIGWLVRRLLRLFVVKAPVA